MTRNLMTSALGITMCLALAGCDDDDFHYESTSRIMPGVLLSPDGEPTGLRLAEVSPEFVFYYDIDGKLKGVDDHDRYYYKANRFNNRLEMRESRSGRLLEETYEFTFHHDLVSTAVVYVKDYERLDHWNYIYHYEFDYNSYGELRRINCDYTTDILENGIATLANFSKTTTIEYRQSNGMLLEVEHHETQAMTPFEEWHDYTFDNYDAEYNLYRQYTPIVLCTIFGDYKNQTGLYGLHAMAMLGYFGPAPMYLPYETKHEWEIVDALGRDRGYDYTSMRYKINNTDEAIDYADGCRYNYD